MFYLILSLEVGLIPPPSGETGGTSTSKTDIPFFVKEDLKFQGNLDITYNDAEGKLVKKKITGSISEQINYNKVDEFSTKSKNSIIANLHNRYKEHQKSCMTVTN